jgi:hypothetical protein
MEPYQASTSQIVHTTNNFQLEVSCSNAVMGDLEENKELSPYPTLVGAVQ